MSVPNESRNSLQLLREWSRQAGGDPTGNENELQALKQIAIARGQTPTGGWNETKTLRAIAYTYGPRPTGSWNDLKTLRSIVSALNVVPEGRTVGNLNEVEALRVIVGSYTSPGEHPECTTIIGSTGLTFELPVGSAGKYYRYRRRATNSSGTAYSWSNAIGPITVPVILVSDTFTAANGTALSGRTPSPTTAGFNWHIITGDAADQTIQTNKASFDDTVTPNAPSLIVNAGQSNAAVTCTVTANAYAGGAIVGVVFRAVDANNYWRAQISSTGFLLAKIVAGAPTTLDSEAFTPVNGTAYTIAIACTGNTIIATAAGFTLTATDAAHNTATEYGLIGYNNVTTFDDFIISQ